MTSDGDTTGNGRILSEDEQRVRGYLVSQGDERDWVDLWPRFIQERGNLLRAMEKVSDEQADFKPDAESWSIREIVEHVLNVSRGGMRRIEDLSAGREPSNIEGGRMPTKFAMLRRHLTEHSIRYSALLERLPPTPNYKITAPHGSFGELNFRSWFVFERVHDTDHVNQIEAVKTAEGYPDA
jgi:uncharacterized damage-inducible protein DinB